MKIQERFSFKYVRFYLKWIISVLCSLIPFFLRGWIACGLQGIVTLELIKQCFTFEDVIWIALNPSIITLVDFIFVIYTWRRSSSTNEFKRVIRWMSTVLILMFIMIVHYVLVLALPENSKFFFKSAIFFSAISVLTCLRSQGIIGGNSR